MEKRAVALGVGGKLRYLFPDNNGLRGVDVDAAMKLGIDAQATLARAITPTLTLILTLTITRTLTLSSGSTRRSRPTCT